MGQIKVYGLATELNACKDKMSDIIHSSIVECFKFPLEKRFHRFFPLEKEDFYFPSSRTSRYTIIEINVFEGRSDDAKRALIRSLFANMKEHLHIDADDIEITIFETPKQNWGIRGVPGDELELSYKVNV